MNPNVRRTTKFTAMPLQQLREPLEGTLHENKYKFITNSVSDDEIILNVKDGLLETTLTLTRQRHRPLELEVIASHESIDRAKQRSREETRNNREYYYIWYLLAFGGIVISSLVYYLETILIGLENATPGLSDTQRNLTFLTILLLLGIVGWRYIWVFMNKDRALAEFNARIADLTCDLLTNMVRSGHVASVIRCWSCLGETSVEAGFCSQCGAQLG